MSISPRPKIQAKIPQAFEFLFRPARYKCAYGGRGSGKSWNFARALIVLATRQKLRVLCAREIQNSIAESVHKLLADQIDLMGLAGWFAVREKSITSLTGSEFIFAGLRTNVTKIKSMEGLNLVWVEEAENISRNSWEKLIPTMRAAGSEIWVTFNPDQEKDETYQRFIVKPPPRSFVKKVSWRDNPDFPSDLAEERDYLARIDPDAYAHVWEGECRTVTDAQVLKGKYSIEAFEPKKGWNGPYFGADWGFSVDPTALVRMWVNERTLYVEHEAYGIAVEIDNLPQLFDRVPDARTHVTRSDNARPETISYLQRHGYPRMCAAAKWTGSVEDGVEHLRSYEKIIIHPRCKHTALEARLWSYKTDRLTGDVLPELLDKHNHCWDAARYGLEPMIKRRAPATVTALRI